MPVKSGTIILRKPWTGAAPVGGDVYCQQWLLNGGLSWAKNIHSVTLSDKKSELGNSRFLFCRHVSHVFTCGNLLLVFLASFFVLCCQWSYTIVIAWAPLGRLHPVRKNRKYLRIVHKSVSSSYLKCARPVTEAVWTVGLIMIIIMCLFSLQSSISKQFLIFVQRKGYFSDTE